MCIKRDLEVLCLLEVQVSVLEGSWRRFWSLGGVLKNFGGHSSLEVHKGWIGALWRYFEALDVHVSTFQHCKS